MQRVPVSMWTMSGPVGVLVSCGPWVKGRWTLPYSPPRRHVPLSCCIRLPRGQERRFASRRHCILYSAGNESHGVVCGL